MNIQANTTSIADDRGTRRPWYITDDRITIPIALPKEIVWARLSETLRRVVVRNGSLLEPRVEYTGRVNGDSIEVDHSVGGRTGTRYSIVGELARTEKGTQMVLAINENRFARFGQTVLALLTAAMIYAFLMGLRGSLFATSNLVATLIFTIIMGIPMLISAGWHRGKALTRTSELLKSIAEGRFYETT